MKSRSVSLTGATGFVGGHIAEAFVSAGWQVRAIVRPDGTRPPPAGIDRVSSPLEPDPLARAIEGTGLVVHCAGLVRAANDAAFAAVNVAGTRAVVAAANRNGIGVVLISSLAAGGTGTPENPRRETDDPAPVNAYGRSKLAGEEVLKANATEPWTILRPSAVYGPGDRGFLPVFRGAAYGLFLRPTAGNMAFTLIDVRDLAHAVVLASATDRAANETFFVGHPAPQTTDDILQALARVFGRRYRPRTIPSGVVRLAARAGDLAWTFGWPLAIDSARYAELSAEGFVCATAHATDRIGFTAERSLERGFRETAEWYRQAKWV